MASYIFVCLLCVVVTFHVSEGQHVQEDAECRREHGACTRHVYENIRLVALRSSDCKNFCQCVHASTELDGSVTYMWVRHECPPTTLFDDSLPAPVCDHDYNVQCHGDDDADCTSEHGACTQFIYENVRLVAQQSSGCKKFCQCAHASTQLDGSVTYKWVEHTCPAGTLFDNSLPARVCNHEDNVQCEGNPVQIELDTTPRPLVQETPANVPQNGGGVDDGECLREHGNCNRDQYENVRLVALRSSGCKNFCQCAHASTLPDGSVTYKWVKKTCPANTLFDESLPAPVCNHDYKVQCPDVESGDCAEEHGVCTQYIYANVRLVPKTSSGCKSFCQCTYASTELDGSVTYKWVEKNCPAGTLFDRSLRVCNHAGEVQCDGNPVHVDTTHRPLVQVTSANVPQNGGGGDDGDCLREHGNCNRDQYENVRLVALRSSGCKNFCQCAHASTLPDGSVTYKWVKKTCPANTLFDESLPAPVCNHDYNVQCPGEVDAVNECEEEHGTCTNAEYENKRLTALISSGCQKFCQCTHASTQPDGSVTYKWVEQTCPPRTLFDESIRVCNHAGVVNC